MYSGEAWKSGKVRMSESDVVDIHHFGLEMLRGGVSILVTIVHATRWLIGAISDPCPFSKLLPFAAYRHQLPGVPVH